MKTDGRIVNSEEEYNQLVSELLQANTVENREIYAPFEFENSYIDLLLDGNGLGLAGYRNSVTINGINMYTGKLRLATSGESINRTEFSQLNRTIEDYANNDKKILELIYKSGALNKETEAERVQAWSDFIRKEFSYDIDALRDGGEDYNKASSIFSAVERKMAMCVGFSTLSARAYNMMGLRAYVVHGKRQNGSPHAITRVYFGNKWHFLDTTASIDGNRYAYLLDTYKEADTSALAGEMVIHRDFEKWLEKQRPRDILLVNNDVAKISPTSSVDSFAERTELQKMYDRVVFDIARYNYLITKLEEKASQPTSIISQSKDAVRELEMYRDDIDVSDKVVKSYLELLDWKIKVLENFAGQVEIGFEIPKFLEQRTANKEETILEKHISSNDSDEDSLHSEDERMSPQEDVQIKKVESTVEEVKELIVPESNGIEESRHNEENSELVENVPVLHESIPTNDNYSDVTLGTVQNIIFSLWNDVSSLFSSN
ncbi:transglutaminase domain-containing protein [Streptococcus hillyeri]|nr:transglutaminase domain-containing protein [Streptococcus hillyeri]